MTEDDLEALRAERDALRAEVARHREEEAVLEDRALHDSGAHRAAMHDIMSSRIEELETERDALRDRAVERDAWVRARVAAWEQKALGMEARIATLTADRDHARHWAVAYRIATERGARISGDFAAYGTASDGWRVGEGQ